MCITYAVSRSPGDTSPQAARFGYIVSKAVGNAVTRNLVRRRLKTISDELIAEGAAGIDVVYRALPRAAEATFAELRREARRGYDRLKVQA